MIHFRTEVGLPTVKYKLSYRQNSMMIGSCFTENIGNYLLKHYFPIHTNPCGILYNPASIAGCIECLLSEKELEQSDLFFSNELWNNFNFHSRFSDPDQEKALKRMNSSLETARYQLKNASHLFFTYGTSWVYRNIENEAIVGNCHKLPAKQFSCERLSVEAMADQWIPLLNQLFELNPDLSITLTVSPIRHLKDGSFENQLSKSALFLLIDRLLAHFGTERITYFPSYELVMDELRDYRFYASDMLHLSDTATAFVQEKFNEVYLDSESQEILFSVEKIVKTLMHKPFNRQNSSYSDVLSKLEEEVLKISSNHPDIDLNDLIIDINQKKGL